MKDAKSILCEQCGHSEIEHNCYDEENEEFTEKYGCRHEGCNCESFKEPPIKTEPKGCGKYVEFWGRYCGQFEDLKHSDHIILCPDCKKENSKQ